LGDFFLFDHAGEGVIKRCAFAGMVSPGLDQLNVTVPSALAAGDARLPPPKAGV
jgi:uncharacterized protein (TIGR03437 family)